MARFVQSLDTLVQEGRVLKDDIVALVGLALWDGHDVVIKRYNHQGLWHALRHTIKGSRARRNWHNARRLIALEIATPPPLAYVDQYRGPVLWQSYFVTRFVAGPQICQVLRDPSVADADKQQMHEQVVDLLNRMARNGVSHGDMKHTNILWDGTDVMLTDLDAMQIGGVGWLRRHYCRRDVQRYQRDLAGLTVTSRPSHGAR